MAQVIFFILSFVFVYFVYYMIVIKREDKLKKMKTSTEFNYLKKVYHIKINQFDLKWLAKKVIMTNAFVISLTVTIASFSSNIILMLLLGFVILFPSILILYHILGKYLQKKESRREHV